MSSESSGSRQRLNFFVHIFLFLSYLRSLLLSRLNGLGMHHIVITDPIAEISNTVQSKIGKRMICHITFT